ncbi:MBL fold metallo-hydrolase [Streptococcus sp. DD13]|uniref:MBL fold metallo-hydrolase n=1 Tax=Streptococcus sp. DD13 TaxID=1777881 RepID=UPI0007967150|nr:MBL fold metallo-hydrolase [Streptococcus sp. DD13]KXT78557.1 Hydroxyacylglutathione hydrolase [Streptococcus sp. DD13]
MNLYKQINPIAYENTYILEKEQSLLVIDPGSDWESIKRQLLILEKPISAILLTHTHYDHILSLERLRETFHRPPVYVAEAEAAWLYQPIDNLSGLPRHDDLEDVICRPAEHFYQYDTPYTIDDFTFQVVPTPGHSIGGVSVIFPSEEVVFSGDALFRETIGRSDLPTGNQDQLLRSIRQQLFTLPNHYRVYPGHGGDTTIGHEKTFNPFF